MKKRISIFLVVLFMALLLAGCDCLLGDACSDFWVAPYQATAEYGAEQFHIQLTAIATAQP